MRHSGARLTILSIVGLFCLGGASRAENIFEMIFGGGRPSAESPAVRVHSPHREASRRHVAHKKRDPAAGAPSPETMKLSYAEVWGDKPDGESDGAGKCCASAADMIVRVTRRDPTLREGDAFMTSDGLQVFVGDRLGDTKFVPVGQAPQMSRALKERLQAMEKAPAGKAARASPSKTRSEGASSPVAKDGFAGKAAKDRLIETANGKTIRLVGGFAN